MKCPDCLGKGTIAMFTSVAGCERCGGTGELADLSLSFNVNLKPPADVPGNPVRELRDIVADMRAAGLTELPPPVGKRLYGGPFSVAHNGQKLDKTRNIILDHSGGAVVMQIMLDESGRMVLRADGKAVVETARRFCAEELQPVSVRAELQAELSSFFAGQNRAIDQLPSLG